MSTAAILTCPVCQTPTQRTPHGGPLDGLLAHQETVHPDRLTVARVAPVDGQEALPTN